MYDDDDRKAEFLCELDTLDKSKAYYTPSYGCFRTANTDQFDALADNAKNAVRITIDFLDNGGKTVVPETQVEAAAISHGDLRFQFSVTATHLNLRE